MQTIRRFVAFVVFACVFATPAFAQNYTYSVYVDSDLNVATGCSVTLSSGNINGVESVVTATIAIGAPPSVVSVTRSNCTGGSFGAPVTEGTAAVSPGAGTDGLTAVELSDAVSALTPPGAQAARVYVVARSATGDDVLTTGGPIIVQLAQAQGVLSTPMFGIPAAILLILFVLALGSRAVRRRIMKPLLLGLVLFSGMSGAMIFQWNGIPPIAIDAGNHTSNGDHDLDLRYLYVAVDNGIIYFRCDILGGLTTPPIAVADSYNVIWNTTLNVPAPGVLANDTVHISLITSHTNPTHGSLTLNLNGSFSYTPNTNYTGPDSFTYTLTNFGGSSTATVSLNVVAGPAAIADSYSTSVGTALNVSAPGVLGNDQLGAPAATLVSFGGGSLGGAVTTNAPGTGVALAGGTLTQNANGSLSLSSPTTPGTYTFQYRISNSQGNSDGTVTIQVNKAPTITSLNAANFVLAAPATFTITTTGTPTVNSITLTGCVLPAGLSFSYTTGANATISGTPTASGTVSCTVTASNGVAPNATQTLTVAVSQAPVATADTYTTTVGTPINTPAPGLLGNDLLGAPAATLTSFGGGDLGGAVTGHAAGTGATLAGGTLSVNANGSFSLTAPSTPGTYTFLYEIGNSQGTSDGTVTIQVNAAPAITSVGPAVFTMGSAGTYTITTTGTPTVTSITLTGCTLQAGLSFSYTSGASATISGTPTANGSVSCTVTADNGVAPAATQSLTVTVNEAPAAVADSFTTNVGTPLTVGAPGLLQNDNLGFPAATLTSFGGGVLGGTVTTNAAGATVALAGGSLTVNADGSLSLTAPTTAGTYTFSYQITNSQGTSDGSVTIQVNQGPTILTPNNVTFLDGSPANFTITTSGTPTVTSITLTGCTLQAGLTFSYTSGASATISGTPTVGGIVNCTVTASNGILPDATQSLMVTVNQGPAAVADTYSTTLGTDINVSAPGVLGNDSLGTPAATVASFGGNSLGGAVTTNAAGASVPLAGGTLTLGSNGALTLTSATQSGQYTFQYRIDNGVSTADAMVTIDVNEAAAITSANNATFVATQPNTFTVTTTGFPKPTISVFSGSLPPGVTLVDNLDGTATISGSPAAADAGPHVVTIQATNGIGAPVQQTFTLQVNVAPAITSASSTTFTVGTAGSFTVTATGTPTPTISETGVLPTGVTFVSGVLSGTPAAGTGGTYPITITASNGVGSNATQSFTLTVNEAPSITSLNNATFVVGTPGTFSVTTTGFPKTGGAMTISESGSLPGGVTFVDNGNGTATLAGTAAAGTGGTYPLTITAHNGVGADATQSFTLQVNQPPAITSANAVTFTVGAFGTFSVTATGTPAPTVSETGTLPTGVSFVGGVLSGTPAANTGGVYPISFTASNGVGSNATQTFTLTVDQAPNITSANNTTFMIGQSSTFTVQTTGFPLNPGMTITETAAPDALPSGVSFVDNGNGTATLAGTPGAGTANGSSKIYGLQIGANNGVPPPASQAFNLTVACPAITLGPAPGTLPSANYNDSSFTQAFTPAGGTSPYTYTVVGSLPNVAFSGNNLQGTPNNTGSFAFTVQATDAYGCNSPVQSYTLNVKPVANNDTYPDTVIGNVSINSANAATPFSTTGNNDQFPAAGTNSISAFDATSVHGGTVSMTTSGATMGQFTYNPAAGYAGADSFTYTLSSNGQTATATVSLTVSGMIWFINNSAGAGDGRLSSPFNSVAAFQAVNNGTGTHPAANQSIFIYESATTYTGPLTLLNGQKLIGQDATATLASITGLTPAPSSAALPVMNSGNATVVTLTSAGNTVTLGSGNTVRGLSFGNATGTALIGASIGSLVVNDVKINTTGAAISLANGALSDGGAGPATFTSVSSGGGTHGISLTTTTGSLLVAGDGASDPANTTVGRTTAKQGGGTIVLGSGGTISGASSSGVFLSSATNVTLRNITITNNGGAGVGTGGDGVNATNGSSLVLDNLLVNGHNGNSGVHATGTAGVALQHVEITNNAMAATIPGLPANTHPSDVRFDNVTGTATVTNSFLHVALENVFSVFENGANTLSLTVTNCQISDTATAAPGNVGLQIVAFNTANVTLNTTGSKFLRNFSNGVQYLGNDQSGGGAVNVSGSDFEANAVDFNLAHQGQGKTVSFNVSNNTFRQTTTGLGNSINLDLGSGSNATTSLVGKILNNVVGTPAISGSTQGNGMAISAGGAGKIVAKIDSNNVQFVKGNDGFNLQPFQFTGRIDLTLTNNQFGVETAASNTNDLFGIDIIAGNDAADAGTVCLNMSGNTSTGNATNAGAGLELLSGIGTPTILLQGYAGATNNDGQITTFEDTGNTVVPAPATVFSSPGTIKAAPSACQTPP